MVKRLKTSVSISMTMERCSESSSEYTYLGEVISNDRTLMARD